MQTNPISVSDITEAIKSVLEDSFDNLTVIGEISNFKHQSSGHRYFTLKDDKAAISVTMWKSRSLNFTPNNGMKVIVSGRITVYPPRGNYQLDAYSMTPAGQGDLFLAYEALKKKLQLAGWFDTEHKKPIPVLPMKIGVSTSPTGAAVRDIMSTIERRFPLAEIYFRPTVVQGDSAAPDIVNAINELNAIDTDLIIIGRGGGSLEDLWAYNIESVAEAIFNSRVPIISAVGHETDFTIADFVADFRAATPTAAAELATPIVADELIQRLKENEKRLEMSLVNKISNMREMIRYTLKDTVIRRIDERINFSHQKLDDSESRMRNSLKYIVNTHKNSLRSLDSNLSAHHPLSPLKKGFAFIKSNGKIIGKNDFLKAGKMIEIIRENETASAKIESIIPPSLFE